MGNRSPVPTWEVRLSTISDFEDPGTDHEVTLDEILEDRDRYAFLSLSVIRDDVARVAYEYGVAFTPSFLTGSAILSPAGTRNSHIGEGQMTIYMPPLYTINNFTRMVTRTNENRVWTFRVRIPSVIPGNLTPPEPSRHEGNVFIRPEDITARLMLAFEEAAALAEVEGRMLILVGWDMQDIFRHMFYRIPESVSLFNGWLDLRRASLDHYGRQVSLANTLQRFGYSNQVGNRLDLNWNQINAGREAIRCIACLYNMANLQVVGNPYENQAQDAEGNNQVDPGALIEHREEHSEIQGLYFPSVSNGFSAAAANAFAAAAAADASAAAMAGASAATGASAAAGAGASAASGAAGASVDNLPNGIEGTDNNTSNSDINHDDEDEEMNLP